MLLVGDYKQMEEMRRERARGFVKMAPQQRGSFSWTLPQPVVGCCMPMVERRKERVCFEAGL